MSDQEKTTNGQEQQVLEGGAYEIIQKRLLGLGDDLLACINNINDKRKTVFGALESKVLGNDRISTDNNCVPRDIISIGDNLLFGYNVFIGMKKETKIADVFSVYRMKDQRFEKMDGTFLNNPAFTKDFQNLYAYYKETRFAMFYTKPGMLLMIFQTGKKSTDIKVFKWIVSGDEITYENDRSEHEFKFPAQHDFDWHKASRDSFVTGKHPHVSIEDRVFVETIGGDLTIKVENNTETGSGIYSEDVDKKDQSLHDADFLYSIMGSIILLKILPYQEELYRHIIFDEKKQKAIRVDDIAQCAIRLPDDDGLIFPGGYYLLNEGYRAFNINTVGMKYLNLVISPNGEDYLYVFYNEDSGEYILLQYNVINKKVEAPILCNGYALYEDGKMIFFKADNDPKKSHAIRIWQTPFLKDIKQASIDMESYIARVGNKDLVRGISDFRSVYSLIRTDEIYLGLYHEIAKKTAETIDLYYWVDNEEVFNPKKILVDIQNNANAAINEHEKVLTIRKNTAESLSTKEADVKVLIDEVSTTTFDDVHKYVDALAKLKSSHGQVITLKELRYIDMRRVEAMETQISDNYRDISESCVSFLLRDEAFTPFYEQITVIEEKIGELKKVVDLDEEGEKITGINEGLDLLNDIVNTLKIDDATQTAEIIEKISDVYSRLNQVKAQFNKHKKSLNQKEMLLEFNAQYKLINQTVANALDQAVTPAKCEEGLTKIMIHIEELEGKFADFDEFVEKLSIKREEVYSTFNNKKVQLEEALNKKTNTLFSSAKRILKGVSTKLATFKEMEEINAYFASDRMVQKVNDIVQKLFELNDSVKAEEIASQLKSIRQEGTRQLKDKKDLYAGGDDLITLGNFKFTVNKQEFGLTTVFRQNDMYYHLTGTNFFEKITDESFLHTRPFWDQSLPGETNEVYRATYLAYKFLTGTVKTGDPLDSMKLKEILKDNERLLEVVRDFMSRFIDEGYEKGVHDQDCMRIVQAVYPVYEQSYTLKYHPVTRCYGLIFWMYAPESIDKKHLRLKIKSLGHLDAVSDSIIYQPRYIDELRALLHEFYHESSYIIEEKYLHQTAYYLFEELKQTGDEPKFAINKHAHEIFTGFNKFLKRNDTFTVFYELLKNAENNPAGKLHIITDWLEYFISANEQFYTRAFLDEAAFLILYHSDTGGTIEDAFDIKAVETGCAVDAMTGDHPTIVENRLVFDISDFLTDLEHFEHAVVEKYKAYVTLKQELVALKEVEMRLNEFKPRILSSFVRNKLIDQVYLPLIGTNLAKQMGAYGDQKRTDLMGLLLLISPPGYGKTTLMEYIANRLGLIFMKINGPAIGHGVVSLDPSQADNATAREEIEKLNLALEMGNNVMLYLDDIQHCNPEFLQKFISLCDAQRKIEGVYRGRTRTYDLRGKKVCVVMAGNPYTESGERFRIPDMLANRADTYNLGDIIGGTEDVFNLSYLENSLTSNTVLNKLAARSQHDVYEMIKIARTGTSEGTNFEVKYSMEELNEYITVFKKLLEVQAILLEVNKLYIYSAGQDEDYRKEPKFLLQGSYRNMNKMAEKVQPIMNDAELKQLILDHYIDESQLLTSGAEFNLLRFKELASYLVDDEKERLLFIRDKFVKNKALGGSHEGDPIGRLMGQVNLFNEQFGDFVNVVKDRKDVKNK